MFNVERLNSYFPLKDNDFVIDEVDEEMIKAAMMEWRSECMYVLVVYYSNIEKKEDITNPTTDHIYSLTVCVAPIVLKYSSLQLLKNC